MNAVFNFSNAAVSISVDDLSEWLHTEGFQSLVDLSQSLCDGAMYLNHDSESDIAKERAAKAFSDLSRLNATLTVIKLVKAQIAQIENQTE